jgi:hypothetical protein
MCSKICSLSQKRDTVLDAALHSLLHAALHAFLMSFSLSNLFFDLSTQKATQRCMLGDVAFMQRNVAVHGLLQCWQSDSDNVHELIRIQLHCRASDRELFMSGS